MYIIRKQNKLSPDKAIFVFIGNESSIYNQYKNPSSFLYFIKTFGFFVLNLKLIILNLIFYCIFKGI